LAVSYYLQRRSWPPKTKNKIEKLKGNIMKLIRNLNRYLTIAGLALAAVGILANPNTIQAQSKGDGAGKLVWSKPIATAADIQSLEAGDIVSMSCPKCKTSQAVVVEKSFKATVPDATKTVTTHLCPGCTTKIVPQGGKQEAKIVHVCNACGSENISCCAIKPGAAPTPGMTN
jgi:hypothetical protein